MLDGERRRLLSPDHSAGPGSQFAPDFSAWCRRELFVGVRAGSDPRFGASDAGRAARGVRQNDIGRPGPGPGAGDPHDCAGLAALRCLLKF